MPHQQKVQCPKCHHSDHVIPIIYGKPGHQAIQQAQKGKIILGGCSPKNERYMCKTCHKKF